MELMRSGRLSALYPRLRRFLCEETPFFLLLALAAAGYLLFLDATGAPLFGHAIHDSYTLQSLAWLRGEPFLADGETRTYLELAIYQGKHFVSFPPVPSLVLLPLVRKFGEETPNTLLVAIYGLLSLVFAYRACLAAGQERGAARFWASFAVFGCNLLQQTTLGGVWMQAQALNFLLLTVGVDAAFRNRRILCFASLALAVGCRPFSILYLPVALVYFLYRDRTGVEPLSLPPLGQEPPCAGARRRGDRRGVHMVQLGPFRESSGIRAQLPAGIPARGERAVPFQLSCGQPLQPVRPRLFGAADRGDRVPGVQRLFVLRHQSPVPRLGGAVPHGRLEPPRESAPARLPPRPRGKTSRCSASTARSAAGSSARGTRST